MTRYALGQATFAVAATVVGTVKAIRILVDWFDDTISAGTGLR